ncbi:MAG: thiamine phosphate synthase [Dongiaceae bacterium]
MYLITPPGLVPGGVSPDAFCHLLVEAIGETQAAALLVDCGNDPAAEAQLEKYLLPLIRQRDFALLLKDRVDLLEATDADGVQLSDPAQIKPQRSKLGDLSIGAVSLLERDAAMTAAEAGADYVAFDPAADPQQGLALVQWWSEMMTVPSVVMATTPTAASPFAEAGTDFIAVTSDIWQQPDPLAALRDFMRVVG